MWFGSRHGNTLAKFVRYFLSKWCQIFTLKLNVILNMLGSNPENYQISHRVQSGMHMHNQRI